MLSSLRMQRPWPVYLLGGIPIDALSRTDLLHSMAQRITSAERGLILNVNVHAMNLAADLPWFRGLLRRADLVFCDGAGVMLAARVMGSRIPERITYADWIWELTEWAAANGWKLFLLGGRPGVAARAAERLIERFSTVTIVGTNHGYFDKSPGCTENTRVVEKINDSDPDILIVAFGMPLQEQWLSENWNALHARVGLTGGAVFDYVAGDLARAPAWMQRHGLEWLGRLFIEPARLWRRYLFGNPRFLLRVLGHWLMSESRSGDDR